MAHTFGLKHACRALLLMTGTLALFLSACGGGYGGSSSSGSGSNGCGGVYGSACPAPTITMTSPGATVNRGVKLTASAGAMGCAPLTPANSRVGAASVGTATAAPYTVSWDSTTVSDGNHTLTGKVTDSQSQTATSAALTVAVKNNPVFSVTMASAQIFPAPS